MQSQTFKALVVRVAEDKTVTRAMEDRRVADLPEGEVVIKVAWSSLNYKDALSATGNKGVTRNYPHTPGIDAAGVVAESRDPRFSAGDKVIVTSYDLGMNTAGGFSEYIRVPADWVVKLPAGLNLREAMIYGTAGFTAAMSVFELESHGMTPIRGEILVSGATGGVGSIAVAILAKMGFSVVGVTGKADAEKEVLALGARAMLPLSEAVDASGRPLLKTRWAGAIDTVGGELLATTLKTVAPRGVVTACGNVAGPELPVTVFPFILRGVTLVGIDSQNCPMEIRQRVWDRLAADWKLPQLESVVSEVSLDGLEERIQMMLQGKNTGRTIVRVSGAL